MDKHRVAITGLGVVTPLGTGKDAFWSALLNGAISIDRITRFDPSVFPSQIAAEINGFDASAYMDRRRLQWTDRFSQLAVVAAILACDDARFPIRNRSDVGVYTGSALGGLAYAEEQLENFHKYGLRAVRPLLAISVFGGAAASNIAIEFGLHGPTIANANSCAAGAIAIGEAFRAVRNGEIVAAIAGGVEAPLAPLTYGVFTVVRAMSTRNEEPRSASRPFDRARDGFVMAEGAGIVVLERYQDAVARGAHIYAEILGFGMSNDANHMAAPLPDGSQTACAMRTALHDARIEPDEIEAINAHGSSTPPGDRAELAAYASVFGERARHIPVSATKGQHGHALGATGAWEVAISALTLQDGVLPGNVNFARADDGCELTCATATGPVDARLILSNSSGFGGINAAIVMQRS